MWIAYNWQDLPRMESVIGSAISCLMLLYGFPFMVKGDFTGVVNNKTASWNDARQNCQGLQPSSSSSCDLSTLSPQHHALFWNSLASQGLSARGSYWVGAFIAEILQWQQSQKPLFMEAGCYVKPEDLRTDIRPLRFNSPERCLVMCASNFVALQGTVCYCVSQQQMASLKQRPLEECHVFCNKDPYRCGGDNSGISVYKIPDRTLLDVSGKSKEFFWHRSQNNEHEFVVLTNKPGKQTKQLCVSPGGIYSSVDMKEACPEGGKVLTFEEGGFRDFLSSTTSLSLNWRDFSFPLPLGYTKNLLWLDGEEVTGVEGQGSCVAVSYGGQHLSLVKKACKDKLPSICACYTQTQRTEQTTTTATTTVAPTTTTQRMRTTTMIQMTTKTTVMSEPSKSTTPESTVPSTPETTTTLSTTTPGMSSTTDSSTTESTTTDAGGKTSRIKAAGSTPVSKKTMTALPTTSPSKTSSATEKPAEVTPDKDGKLLFPFSDMKEKSDGPLRAAPPLDEDSEQSTEEEGDSTATFSASIGMIVGTAVGAVALIILVVIVIVVIMRRKQESSSATLLKNKGKKSASSSTNYPI